MKGQQVMGISTSSDVPAQSPQKRGRELASQGKKLWAQMGSVKAAAAALMSRYPEVPSLQAFRYAAGLSQDHAAARYNEVTGNQTSLGGTTINAWESWARVRGHGSPPSISSLLIMCTAYGRGPMGVSDEEITPAELIAECYERLPIEDQLALKAYNSTEFKFADDSTIESDVHGLERTGATHIDHYEQIGSDFIISAPTVEHGNSEINLFTLPNHRPGRLLDLTWTTFGYGVERLSLQIKNLGKRLDVDACFGINEAGLVMATFLASSRFSRCPIGYLRCNKVRDGIELDQLSFYPETKDAPTIVICDFEVKHADVIGQIARELRQRYPEAELYFAVFGAMTKDVTLEVASFDDLTGAQIMRAADFEAVFIAATMSPPGIEPPLELR